VLGAGATRCDVERFSGYGGMMADPHKTVVPHEIIAGIRRWLEQQHEAASASSDRTIHLVRRHRTHVTMAVGDRTVREEAFEFGSTHGLFGVLTTPASAGASAPAPARQTAVILLNPGAVHRVGCNRMWVTWARSWAALGYTVLRMDIAGVGDSPAIDGMGENVTYDARSIDDVRAAIDALTERRGLRRFVLAGLCSGAYLSFHAALAIQPLAGVMLLNPVTFCFKPGMSLDVTPARVFQQTTHYREAFFRPDTWKKAWRGDIDMKSVAENIARRLMVVGAARFGPLLRRVGLMNNADHLDADMKRLADKGVDSLLVFADKEPGLEAIRLSAARTFRKLCDEGRFQLRMVPSTDHTFTPVWSQARLATALTDHLLARHP